MRRKVLAILVSVIMVVGLLPAAAFADTINYDVWVGGTQVTSNNMNDVLGDGMGTVQFTPASGEKLAQLVLNNATITGAAGHGGFDTSSVGIEAKIDMEMVLVGNNSVAAQDGENNSIAICTNNALAISGDGSLTATAAKGKGMHSYGIYTEGTLTIESGNIVAVGQGAKYYSSGICCYEASATINGGSVTASGGSGNSGIYGISVSNSFDINGGTVTASGKTKAFNQNPNLSAYTDPAVTVNTEAESDGASEWNGATALGGDASPYRYVMIAAEHKILYIAGKGYTAADLAVDVDKIDDEGWSWDAAAQEVTLSGYDSGYIYSKQALTVNLADGTDNTITVPNTANRNGIHTKGKLTLTGTGNLDIAVPNTYYDGIYSEDGDVVVDMAGGLTVNAGGQGISVNNGNNNVTLSGDGAVAITAGGEGIYANAGNVTISSAGAVTITAGGDGIYSEAGDVTLSGSGAVTITAADDDCIEAHNGDVILSGSGDIEFTAPYGIYTYTDGKNVVINMTGKLTITADYDGILSSGGVTITGDSAVMITAGSDGICVDNSVTLSGNRAVAITADGDGIYADDVVTLSGSGAVTITADGDGIYADDVVTLSGSGAVTITADGEGIYSDEGDVIHSGKGRFSVTADGYAVYLDTTGKSLLLNGTGVPLSFTAGDGYKAIYNGDEDSSPVGGTNIAYYNKVTGAPDTESVVYNHVSSSSATTSCTLTFSTNGGSAINSVTKPSGTAINLADYVPTREGYDFVGWYSDEELTAAVTSVLLMYDSTVYAKWTEGETEEAVSDAALPFTDVTTDDWFYEAVEYVYGSGLMEGTGETTFSPNMTTTRGMIVTILYRLEKEPAVSGQNPFNDVEEGSYYDKAINWAAANGIVEGYNEEEFGPDDDITREQVAAILYRYAAFKGYDVTKTADLTKFSDNEDISSWAAAVMSWANAEGLITGTTDATLLPSDNATRAQLAAILYRFIKMN